MRRQIQALIFIYLLAISLPAQVKVILDTDPSADPDDVGCMAMLHNLASLGECEILAIINSTEYKQSSLSISAINQFYGRPTIPIGDYKGYIEKIESVERNYDYHLSRVYPRHLRSWKEAHDGVKLYREILASADDLSITIVIIGTMHNFYGLLNSKSDQFSALDGQDLVKQKVAQVVTMGGNFIDGQGYDRTNWGGSDVLCDYTEWSCLNKERNGMCRYVIEHCPSPFIASGWEVGCGDYHNANRGNVITGQGVKDLDTSHILRRSYEYHFYTRGETENISRHSNDQCALHYAIRGEQDNYKAYQNGKIQLSQSGVCTYIEQAGGKQGYIQKRNHKDSIAVEIESLMMMSTPKTEYSQPSLPVGFVYNRSSKRMSWGASYDSGIDSWVVAYNIYCNDHLIHTAYGTQYFPDSLNQNDSFSIRSINSDGIESEPVSLRIQ